MGGILFFVIDSNTLVQLVEAYEQSDKKYEKLEDYITLTAINLNITKTVIVEMCLDSFQKAMVSR
jgi:hypothetical protein